MTGLASTPPSPRFPLGGGRTTALAELAGTSAQAVGNYIANHSQEPNAYRVLSAYGAVSATFHWADENDDRDVQQVLEAEGIKFNDDGYASGGISGSLQKSWGPLIEAPGDELFDDAALTAPAAE